MLARCHAHARVFTADAVVDLKSLFKTERSCLRQHECERNWAYLGPWPLIVVTVLTDSRPLSKLLSFTNLFLRVVSLF